MKHTITKLHKRRVKQLLGDRPHNKTDAELAGGMGLPDNGPRIRSESSVAVAMAI